jgi:hypothetical protein
MALIEVKMGAAGEEGARVDTTDSGLTWIKGSGGQKPLALVVRPIQRRHKVKGSGYVSRVKRVA